MRLALIIGAIGGIAIILILLIQMQPKAIEREVVESIINARIEVNNSNIVFMDEFIIDSIRLSELHINIDDARSPLDALANSKAIATLKSNDLTKEYILVFDDKMIRLEARDGLLRAEYEDKVIPDRLIIKGEKQIELAIKPLVKEVINDNAIYYEVRRARINGQEIIVEIADTDDKRALGLMHRDYLPQRGGMFFVLDTEGKTSFWMKNMLISLDMIWLDSNGKVVDITKYAQPCLDDIDACTYTPNKPVKYVLEVNAGFADRYNIKVGDTIEFI